MEDRELLSRTVHSTWKAALVGGLLPIVLLWLLSLSSPPISGFGEIMRLPARQLGDWWGSDSKLLNPNLVNGILGALLFAAGAIHWHLVLKPTIYKRGLAVTERTICKCILVALACLVCGFLSPIALAWATAGAQHLSSNLGARFESLELALYKPAEHLTLTTLGSVEPEYIILALLLGCFYTFCFFFWKLVVKPLWWSLAKGDQKEIA